jgi:hypothetical protein
MTRRYAENTSVSVERTQAEISALLASHGATARAVAMDDTTETASVMFALAGRQVRVDVALHPKGETENAPRGSRYWGPDERRRWQEGRRQQQARSTWRGLLLLLKAKLEAVEGGYTTVEREFLADVILPGGRSVAEMVSAVVERAYLTGKPPLLTEASS